MKTFKLEAGWLLIKLGVDHGDVQSGTVVKTGSTHIPVGVVVYFPQDKALKFRLSTEHYLLIGAREVIAQEHKE